ncbi:antibiotic biosynthesis monooxygenase [Lacibacter luteus]|uniref:Antibiotic biosynthesis monooxygenase n=2 Tax=Lacibacter luteus TaxID=2508719 RepID=A0A4Q1CL35_9BACT|nr:antibiotic biosynthesis monooxygenase [Lacibacter luteus]
MKIRIAEIEIHPQFVTEYIAILKEESRASVLLEPGVISIFPMFQNNDSTQIRILEIYANEEAYKNHLTTAHFQKYKTTTLKMVKSLKLIDMQAIDKETLSEIFKKQKN